MKEKINSTYTLKSDDFSGGSVEIMSSYVKSMADLGVFRSKTVNVMTPSGSKHPVWASSAPCNPHHGGRGGGVMAAPPLAVAREGLWCVAKPSVTSEKLQEAMDYACGDGGADCGLISPTGSCYSPRWY